MKKGYKLISVLDRCKIYCCWIILLSSLRKILASCWYREESRKASCWYLRREESRIIGLRFDGGPFTLFGFWSGFNMPYVSAMLLYILPICSCILSDVYLISSKGISSQPGRFWLHFGYCFSDLISYERYRHSCGWYDCFWLFIFIVSLFKTFHNNLTLLCRVGGQTVFSFY